MKTVGVVGLGLLGRGIAACFLAHGYHVIGYARDESEHAEARRHIERMISELIVDAGFKPELRSEWARRYSAVTDFESFRAAEFVVESVTEDAAVKESVYDQLEAVTLPGVVIASNTSAIPISVLQRGRKEPGRFVGMHWAEPAHSTRFIELIRGEQTSEAAFESTAKLARTLGKEAAMCRKDVPGFIVNRIAYAMYREACHLIESGIADAATIDTAIRNTLGLWATICGPLRWIDISGGPELYARAMARVAPTLSNRTDIPPTMQKLAEAGAKGIANGHGFYEYTPEEARYWEELHRKHAWTATQMINAYFPIQEERR